MVQADLQKLIESGAHYGHQSRRWNPKMAEYLHGEEEGVHVFDLFKTKEELDNALGEITETSKEGKKILLVGTKKQAKEKVVEVAGEANIFFVNERWLGGTITNFAQIKKSTKNLSEMKEKLAAGEYKKYTKKERLLIEREIARLTRFFGGIEKMVDLPDLVIVIDIKKEAGALREAGMKGIKTIALVDSNCDPTLVDYPIPMNDDATRALEYVLDLIKEAVLEGKGTKSKVAKKVKRKQRNKRKKIHRLGQKNKGEDKKTKTGKK